MTAKIYKIFPIYACEIAGRKSGKSRIKRVYPFTTKDGALSLSISERHAKIMNKRNK